VGSGRNGGAVVLSLSAAVVAHWPPQWQWAGRDTSRAPAGQLRGQPAAGREGQTAAKWAQLGPAGSN